MRPIAIYFITAAMAATAALAGCSDEDNSPDIYPPEAAPDFTATIDGASSRAYDDTWEAGDEIGISSGSRANVCYTTAEGDGRFAVAQAGRQIYFTDDSEETFTAYYPWYDLDPGAKIVNADTRAQNDSKSFDFLWSQASGDIDNPAVDFTFAHVMAKLSLTIKPGSGVTLDEIKEGRLTLKGIRHMGQFNTVTGATRAIADSEADAEQWVFTTASFTEEGNALTYALIFFPQSFKEPMELRAEFDDGSNLSARIDFTNANQELHGTAAINELIKGRQYNLRVTIRKASMIIDNPSITDWSETGLKAPATSE